MDKSDSRLLPALQRMHDEIGAGTGVRFIDRGDMGGDGDGGGLISGREASNARR